MGVSKKHFPFKAESSRQSHGFDGMIFTFSEFFYGFNLLSFGEDNHNPEGENFTIRLSSGPFFGEPQYCSYAAADHYHAAQRNP